VNVLVVSTGQALFAVQLISVLGRIEDREDSIILTQWSFFDGVGENLKTPHQTDKNLRSTLWKSPSV